MTTTAPSDGDAADAPAAEADSPATDVADAVSAAADADTSKRGAGDKRYRLVVDDACAGLRLDKALVVMLQARGVFATRADVQRWIKAGRVTRAGQTVAVRNRDVAQRGAELWVQPTAPPLSRAEPDASITFEILFEDEHLLILVKPPHLVVHPARGHPDGTLVNGLLALPGFVADNADPRDPEGHLRPGIVHRLDKDTSGVMVVAKHPAAREGLKALFAAHDIERHYLALVQGQAAQARYETPFGRHPKHRLRFTSKQLRASAKAKHAITEVTPIEPLQGATLVRCTLHTGRTHQIRVHMAEQSGTPVVADALYGRKPHREPLRHIAETLGRQALHAGVLGFVHPMTKHPLRFETPLPADMQQSLDALR